MTDPRPSAAAPLLVGRRIALVLPTSTGGIGTHVRSVLPELFSAGATVVVCGPRATEELFGFTGAGAQFQPVEIAVGLSLLADARAVAALRTATAGADLVHAHGLRAGLVAGLVDAAGRVFPSAAARAIAARRPLVLTLHNPVPDGPGPRARLLAATGRATVGAADVVLGASADLAATARRLGAPDVRLAPVSAPPLPAPIRSPAQVRADLGLADGQPLVVAVGRLHAQKGYDVLLTAAARWSADARLPAVPLVAVAGEGPLAAQLAERIAEQRLPVRLLGRRDDVADLLAAADVCVLPSRWEARSLTAQDALRSGTPLVATRTGGLPELLGDAAELVPVGDAGALAEAVVTVLTDPARAGALAAAGPRQAAGWPDGAATGRQLAALYRELLGGLPPAG